MHEAEVRSVFGGPGIGKHLLDAHHHLFHDCTQILFHLSSFRKKKVDYGVRKRQGHHNSSVTGLQRRHYNAEAHAKVAGK